MKFTVKRSEWLHGEGNVVSRLLRPTDQKKCCLGFLALACGFSEPEIEYIATPSDVDGADKFLDLGLVEDNGDGDTPLFANTEDAERLMDLNDAIIGEVDEGSPGYIESEADREARLRSVFAGLGIVVKFVD